MPRQPGVGVGQLFDGTPDSARGSVESFVADHDDFATRGAGAGDQWNGDDLPLGEADDARPCGRNSCRPAT